MLVSKLIAKSSKMVPILKQHGDIAHLRNKASQVVKEELWLIGKTYGRCWLNLFSAISCAALFAKGKSPHLGFVFHELIESIAG
jgi:hypothetical protein